MLQYDPATQAAVSIQMPSEIQASNTTGPYLAATIWNGIRNTVITAGTPITTNPNFVLYEYSATTGWTVIVQQGNIPIADDAYCLVPAYGGTKLVYFGGTHLGFYNTNVYMFDIATNTWTLMASQISQSARVGMQCAASGDMFVVWGGGPVRDSLASPTPLVYNMKSQMWQVTFEAPTSTNTSTPTSTSTSTSPSASTSASASTSKGPIIGGVVGGLFVIGLIAGAFVYRRRRSNRNKEYTVTEGTSVSVGGERKPSDDMNGRPRSFAIGQKQGDASGMHPNPYISYPKPPGSQYMSENTSGVPLRGPQVYSSDQSGPQVWSQRLERNPQEGYQTGFQDPL
ncbi:hypothetical protein EDD21DRAFT_387674 [Dissophora ornata]|nr:hypothetical protein EDD21DRAFT_387674 [Dissophora ornata]